MVPLFHNKWVATLHKSFAEQSRKWRVVCLLEKLVLRNLSLLLKKSIELKSGAELNIFSDKVALRWRSVEDFQERSHPSGAELKHFFKKNALYTC